MISIDRSSNRPVYEQLLEQLRYLIATGKYNVGEMLPSTRGMGKQLDISFHTVRKTYQQLEREGLIESRVGSGYTVIEHVPLGKAEQMERGAALVSDTLHRLIGLGLNEKEIEYLFQEQLTFIEPYSTGSKIIFVAPYQEMAESCAKQASDYLQMRVDPIVRKDILKNQDAEFALVPYADLGTTMTQLPLADVIGMVVYPPPETLASVARMLPSETIGLVTQHPEGIESIRDELKRLTGFSGQLLAIPMDARKTDLEHMLNQVDLVVYTPQCKRKLLPHLNELPAVAIAPVISPDSLKVLRQRISS